MFALNPVTDIDVVVVVPIDAPFLNTSYPVTPTLSVEAVHESVKLVCVLLLATNPVGTLGACMSGPPALVVTFNAVLWFDQLPAASLALTVIL